MFTARSSGKFWRKARHFRSRVYRKADSCIPLPHQFEAQLNGAWLAVALLPGEGVGLRREVCAEVRIERVRVIAHRKHVEAIERVEGLGPELEAHPFRNLHGLVKRQVNVLVRRLELERY